MANPLPVGKTVPDRLPLSHSMPCTCEGQSACVACMHVYGEVMIIVRDTIARI